MAIPTALIKAAGEAVLGAAIQGAVGGVARLAIQKKEEHVDPYLETLANGYVPPRQYVERRRSVYEEEPIYVYRQQNQMPLSPPVVHPGDV